MTTMVDVFEEIPRLNGRIPETFQPFDRLLRHYKFSSDELGYLQKEIIAARNRLGMLRGRNRRTRVDGVWTYAPEGDKPGRK